MLTKHDLATLDTVLEAYRRCRDQIESVSTADARPNRDLAAVELTKAWLSFAMEIEKNN
jgi:hypothetical protein